MTNANVDDCKDVDVSFVFCAYIFSCSCSCSTLLSHFVYWIVLSAGLASLTIQQPQLLSCTMSLLSVLLLLWLNKFMFMFMFIILAVYLHVGVVEGGVVQFPVSCLCLRIDLRCVYLLLSCRILNAKNKRRRRQLL